ERDRKPPAWSFSAFREIHFSEVEPSSGSENVGEGREEGRQEGSENRERPGTPAGGVRCVAETPALGRGDPADVSEPGGGIPGVVGGVGQQGRGPLRKEHARDWAVRDYKRHLKTARR